jgi:hypothetical protein
MVLNNDFNQSSVVFDITTSTPTDTGELSSCAPTRTLTSLLPSEHHHHLILHLCLLDRGISGCMHHFTPIMDD